MKKGKLVLRPLNDEKIGGKVIVPINGIPEIFIMGARDRKISNYYPILRDGKQVDTALFGELQELMMEFDVPIMSADSFDQTVYTNKEYIPLYPEQWDWARAFIDREIDVELINEDGTQVYAKIRTATPVRSIEDIPEELRKNYPPDFDFLAIPLDKEEKNLLKEAHEVLRSCNAIIERRGADTNWVMIEKQVKKMCSKISKYYTDGYIRTEN